MGGLKHQKPVSLGYRMPAEWEPHAATWMSWPQPDGVSFPGSYERVVPTFVKMIEVLSESEPVHLNVISLEQEKLVRAMLSTNARKQVRFFPFPTNEPWCRDHGPIFVKKNAEGADAESVAVTDWLFNAWGNKYRHDSDNAIPKQIAQALHVPRFEAPLVLEGGSIDVNGAGTLLTTESCLLNPNRNPSLSKREIEEVLEDYLGVNQVLWLGEGIEGDDTDGHIDDLSRFVRTDTILTVVEENKADSNYEPLQNNLKRLEQMKLENGSALNIVTVPMPARIDREDIRLPASYANFYIANQCVLLPTFHDPNDAVAAQVLKELLPDREVVSIDCRELIWGLGAFHCLTQQQPA